MLRSRKQSIFRFNHALPPHVPLAVRSAGEYEMRPGSLVEGAAKKWFVEVFWSVEGRGEIRPGNRVLPISGRQVFFLLPGEVHDIRPVSDLWKYHWLTLDHPESPRWLEAFGLTHRPIATGPCPEQLFRKLRRALRLGTMDGDRQAAHLAHAILLAASEGQVRPLSHTPPAWVDACRQQIDREYADPALNVTALAQTVGMHRATLFRAFVAAHGMTPSRYLQNRRLHQALEFLKQSDLTVKEVASAVGMNDANYLARNIRQLTGLAPREFRAAHRRDEKPSVDGRG